VLFYVLVISRDGLPTRTPLGAIGLTQSPRACTAMFTVQESSGKPLGDPSLPA
jgi:hypothetical protein